MIPRGYEGLDSRNLDYQRGFSILFDGGKASLNVHSDVNSLEYGDARAAAEADLEDRKRSGVEIISSEFQSTRLGSQPADTLRVRYMCSPRGPEYLWIETVALSPDGGYVYTISLEGVPSKSASHLDVMVGITRSWSFLNPK